MEPSIQLTTSSTTFSFHPSIAQSIDQQNQLIAINIFAQPPVKLTQTNFASWRLQFNTLLIYYDLMKFVDGSFSCPSPTNTDGTNPQLGILSIDLLRSIDSQCDHWFSLILPCLLHCLCQNLSRGNGHSSLYLCQAIHGHVFHLKGQLRHLSLAN